MALATRRATMNLCGEVPRLALNAREKYDRLSRSRSARSSTRIGRSRVASI